MPCRTKAVVNLELKVGTAENQFELVDYHIADRQMQMLCRGSSRSLYCRQRPSQQLFPVDRRRQGNARRGERSLRIVREAQKGPLEAMTDSLPDPILKAAVKVRLLQG